MIMLAAKRFIFISLCSVAVNKIALTQFNTHQSTVGFHTHCADIAAAIFT